MKISTILYLLLNVLILLTSCSVPKNCIQCDLSASIEPNPVIALKNETPVLYSTDIQVTKYHFSGLVAFRQMPDSAGIRIVFLTEVGIRMMEFSYINNVIKNTYCFDAINRKSIVSLMSAFVDFLLEQPDCKNICYNSSENKSNYFCKSKKGSAVFVYIDNSKDQVIFSEGSKKSAVAKYISSSYLPDEIQVKMKHRTVIQMKKVNNAFK
jgi:hypothetical protein